MFKRFKREEEQYKPIEWMSSGYNNWAKDMFELKKLIERGYTEKEIKDMGGYDDAIIAKAFYFYK